jgi:hypothetical protein
MATCIFTRSFNCPDGQKNFQFRYSHGHGISSVVIQPTLAVEQVLYTVWNKMIYI